MGNCAVTTLEKVADATHLRRTFACFPSGVAAVCAAVDEGPMGLLVSSFTSVSLDPPLASVCIMHDSKRWARLRDTPRLGVSFLGDGQQQKCKQFSGPLEQVFDGLDFSATRDGAVLLHGTTAWLDCSLHDEIPAGDHIIALLRIVGLESRPAQAPLVFHNSAFHRLAVSDQA